MNPEGPELTAAGVDSALTDTVVALREEIRGLRAASQTRAVIEQAKGVLVARHQISLEEAFDRLRALSQQHNVRLIEVAATVVGVAVPGDVTPTTVMGEEVLLRRLPGSSAPSPTWSRLAQQPDVRSGVVQVLIDSVASSTDHGDEAAHLLADLLAPQSVTGVTLYRASADGSLRLLGQAGVPGDLVSSWRSIPPSRDIPYVRSMMEDREYFWGDRAARLAEFPAVASAASPFEATATIPIHDSGATVGVVGLMWSSAQDFDEGRIESLSAEVARVAPILLRNAASVDPELGWLTTLLGLQLDPWVLLEADPGSDGRAGDFWVRDASPQIGDASGWIGLRVVELLPSIAEDPVVRALPELARTGVSWSTTVVTGSTAPWGIPGTAVRAARLGRRVVVVWRPGAL